MGSNWHESCGIFGVYAPGEDVARLTFFGLFALQHRGQESAGIATSDGQRLFHHTGMGLVPRVFNEDVLARLKGSFAIGHNRYSTTGSSRPANAQPVLVEGPWGPLALAHNGNIVNAAYLRRELAEQGLTFRTSTDSEVAAQLIAHAPGRNWFDRIQSAMARLSGAYCLVMLTKDALIGVRDPLGIRPLCIGRLDGGWVLASETCALDHIGAQFVREVEPGEIVVIDGSGMSSRRVWSNHRQAFCIFEYIYFARPDSVINGRRLYLAREAMGARLADEYPVEVDMVMGIPDSATAAGIGYARHSGIPFREGLIKNRYVGRTFIEPDQRLREVGVQLKFNPLPEVLQGRRLVVVDDSIVRGTTTPRVVRLLRRAGAKEVHLRICAPPLRYPCFFGVDMATQWELIASHKTVPEIAQAIGVDSLGYLSLEGLIHAVGLPRETFCLACFTGEYPIPVQLEMGKLALETT
ncbi:MAG: amidophosphoribosyltransferase [Chloroflexota bacterium]|nr:amidophosphoribosyltransferase [Chloroflexota bacterium]